VTADRTGRGAAIATAIEAVAVDRRLASGRSLLT
jgi:hypothetical protein